MVHLYALVDHPARLADVEGSELAAADAGGIDAVYAHAAPDSPPLEEAVLAHARVVEALAAANDAVLPARYPGRYDDEAALLQAIRGRGAQLRDALERVRGCVEMGVRVVRKERAGDDAARTGAEYMRRRLAAIREAERIAAELEAASAAFVRDGAVRVTATDDLVLSAAYLLPREAAEPLRTAVDEVARHSTELAYVCVGPWPPYSFALVDGDEGTP